MTNGIDKRALFKLTTEPYLNPISDLGIGFYNLDENTAYIDFQLKNSKGALQIHENNLTAYAYFEASNGSVSDVIEMDIKDPHKGIVSIKLDSEFLQASTDSTVVGQMYIAVNNVKGNPEYNEVAVFQEFRFEVADALINKISAKTKVENIRMFSQLKQHIQNNVKEIEKAIKSGSDYVAEMKSVLQQGVETLNAIVTEGTGDIQSFINQAKINLTKVKEDATTDITSTASNAKSSVQETASSAVNNITTKADVATKYVDSKVDEFNQAIAANEFLTPDKLNSDLEKLQWQKHKLTNDDGSAQTISLSNDVDTLHNLDAGNYYFTDTPITGSSSTAGFATVERRDEIVKRITFQPYNSTQIWLKRFFNTWSDWERVDSTQSDTGWVPLVLINGTQPYDGSSNPKYRLVQNDSVNTLVLKGAVKNISSTPITIATLPSNISSLILDDRPFVQNTSITSGNASFARWVLKPNGDIELFRTSAGNTTVETTDYFPIDLTIIL
ncbi:BppU family phage baseplate upper protein [Staphylococcus delphini]|uniref:BppU family phage baseplate upper protein n=1 Tax=Staphylococcus delphini TaxID=53344 RepID=UPI0012D344AE|nr:BppU family phage baseplate upper protein [Staphylococcus delphini]